MSMTELSLVGGRVIDPASGHDAQVDLHCSKGKIIALGEAPPHFSADTRIDAAGKIVCPGLVDLCTRLGEPGYEQRGTIHSEARAGALSGVTSMICLPDTQPVADEPSVVELILHRAQQAGFARVLPLGALTVGLQGERLTEAAALVRQGCVGLSHANHPIGNTRVLRRAMEYANTFNIPLLLQPQDGWLANGGCAHEGEVSTRLGLPGIPVAAETVAIAQLIELAALIGARLHLSRITSRRGIAMVREAKRSGLSITADVSINHLQLTEMDVSGFNSQCHVLPPLRGQHDREALIEAVIDGTVDAVCSDHNPCESDAKMAPFAATHPGIAGIETLLPLLLRLTDSGLSMSDCLALATSAPANILGIAAGSLAVGAPADICVLDPELEWVMSHDLLNSRGTNTPYDGWLLRGKAVTTLVGGHVV